MLRKLQILFLLTLLAACTARPTPAPTPSANQAAIEEPAVYAVLLSNLYSSSTYVISENTATGPTGVEDTSQTLDYVLKNMHAVAPETVDSFRVRNDQAYPLRANLKLGFDYTLLSPDQRNQIFSQNQSGWEEFYRKYPQAPGLTALSRVGFNRTFDQALVYIGTQSNWLAGVGYYVLLRKANGAWSIDQKVMTWIS